MQRGVYWREHFQNKLDFEKSILQGRCRVHHLQLMLMRLLFIKSASPQKKNTVRSHEYFVVIYYLVKFPTLHGWSHMPIDFSFSTTFQPILQIFWHPQYNWPFLKFIIYNFLMGVFPMDLICMNIRISCWKVELLAFF